MMEIATTQKSTVTSIPSIIIDIKVPPHILSKSPARDLIPPGWDWQEIGFSVLACCGVNENRIRSCDGVGLIPYEFPRVDTHFPSLAKRFSSSEKWRRCNPLCSGRSPGCHNLQMRLSVAFQFLQNIH